MQEILVEHIMSRDVPVIAADSSLADTVRHMAARSMSCVFLVRENRAIGILTESDMLSIAARALAGELNWEESVNRHMSADLVYLRTEQSLLEALVVARSHEVRHLPVLNAQDHLVGLVTATELARAHFSVFESDREAAESVGGKTADELVSATARLRILSLEDPLLGIGNRRALERDLEQVESASIRYQHVYTLGLFDVDRFKAYNDHYGHQAGDQVLRDIVASFKNSMRSADRLYRYGGEEILLLMPETELEGGRLVVERLRAGLEALALPHVKARRGIITVSCGIAEGGFRHGESGWETVLQAADRALYRAKKAGRNKVVASDTGSSR